jgi:hypothetical protein
LFCRFFFSGEKKKRRKKKSPLGIMKKRESIFSPNIVLWVQPFFQERLHVFIQNRSK